MNTGPGSSRSKDLPRRDGADSSARLIASVGRKLSEDADFRRRIAADPRSAFVERGVDIPPGIELRVSANTDDTFHLVFPADPNEELADETLDAISGGRASTGGTAGCASTASTLASCWGSFGSASSVSSIAS